MRATGLIPDRAESRERDARDLGWFAAPENGNPVQPIAWIRDQRSFPSCVGQAFAAAIDAARMAPPWASAVSIWREARRLQGKIERIDQGTRLEYAVEGLVGRGWDPYRAGEDLDAVEAGQGAAPAGDDLADELFAHDKRATGRRRFRISGTAADVLDATELSVRTQMGVVIGTGVRQPFFGYRGDPSKDDPILSTLHLGGSSNGHGMRVAAVGWRLGARVFVLQNSWGPNWGGCHLPDGTWQPGCCWVSERVLVEAWDRHVVEVHS